MDRSTVVLLTIFGSVFFLAGVGVRLAMPDLPPSPLNERLKEDLAQMREKYLPPGSGGGVESWHRSPLAAKEAAYTSAVESRKRYSFWSGLLILFGLVGLACGPGSVRLTKRGRQ